MTQRRGLHDCVNCHSTQWYCGIASLFIQHYCIAPSIVNSTTWLRQFPLAPRDCANFPTWSELHIVTHVSAPYHSHGCGHSVESNQRMIIRGRLAMPRGVCLFNMSWASRRSTRNTSNSATQNVWFHILNNRVRDRSPKMNIRQNASRRPVLYLHVGFIVWYT